MCNHTSAVLKTRLSIGEGCGLNFKEVQLLLQEIRPASGFAHLGTLHIIYIGKVSIFYN